jgi:hypothetical protein
MFTVLDGEVRVTFRGQTIVARAGQTINVPANAPHSFTNALATPSRLLCMCAPAGQEEFFTLVGQPVDTRTEAPRRSAQTDRRHSSQDRQAWPLSSGPSCYRLAATSGSRIDIDHGCLRGHGLAGHMGEERPAADSADHRRADPG